MPRRTRTRDTRDTRTPTPTPPPPSPSQNPIPTSSPLSSLPTDSSFATATADSPNATNGHPSRGSGGAEDEIESGGDEATVVSDNGRDRTGDEGRDPPQYHKAKNLPPELKEHCRVYLEEALPRQAIFLLDSLLSTRPTDPYVPAYCPPPSQISLICSNIVHPDFTTRPKEPDWPQISLQSLAYLRDLLAVFGPLHAGFKESVLFGTNATSDLDPDMNVMAPDGDGNGLDADERGLVRLSPRYGNDSVWQRGRDFFSLVGWAFNCSVLYPERWQWWARWLGFMLDLLEKDVEERHRLDMKNGSDDMPLLQSSILASYIAQRSGRTADVTMWAMKALFADGDTPSTSVFQEVWPREHKSRSPLQQRTPNKRKRENVNIDKGEYGGYLDDESVHSSQASEPPTPQKNRKAMLSSLPTLADADILETAYGETIPLRQRLFSLMSYLCYTLNDTSPMDFSNLYKRFEQKVKELPLPIFSSFINHATSMLRVDQQIEMLQGVLFLFLPPGALSPRKVDRERFEDGGISPAILERCFLPYPANTIEVEDNVKMSLLLENLLMLVWRHIDDGDGEECFSENLTRAARTGIEARRDKINKKKTRGGRGAAAAKGFSDVEGEAKALLEASDARLAWLSEAIVVSTSTAAEAGNDDDAMDEDG
ncbi:hypothetical protein F5B22DRAFT_632334 [Xylaria bambusicola]|uniref:uncharacterized protein n=1 Tax=Xylaria bambusicola TaxID=326684 RepID=UPI002007B50E|nr:uncharacterized protein F5B22DRAFT_632334 [Xylaria bambusicola]KAI0527719.1 hypothetical protein F5B22DRAFT_632334 [Xylaria bambusicola]